MLVLQHVKRFYFIKGMLNIALFGIGKVNRAAVQTMYSLFYYIKFIIQYTGYTLLLID